MIGSLNSRCQFGVPSLSRTLKTSLGRGTTTSSSWVAGNLVRSMYLGGAAAKPVVAAQKRFVAKTIRPKLLFIRAPSKCDTAKQATNEGINLAACFADPFLPASPPLLARVMSEKRDIFGHGSAL